MLSYIYPKSPCVCASLYLSQSFEVRPIILISPNYAGPSKHTSDGHAVIIYFQYMMGNSPPIVFLKAHVGVHKYMDAFLFLGAFSFKSPQTA